MTDHPATHTPQAAWHISSHSANGSGQCVEAGLVLDGSGRRAVRDSTRPSAGTIDVSGGAWRAFVAGIVTV